MASYIVDTAQVLSASSGADSVWVQTAGAGNSTVYGLAGNDTITLNATTNASALGTEIRGADGADSIYIDSASFSAGGPKVYAGAGADTVTLDNNGVISVLNTNEDNDLVNAIGGVTISAATFASGADTLIISGTIGTLGMGNGHDTVSGAIVTVTTSNTLKLGDGRDTIAIASLEGGSAVKIHGDTGSNYGADSIQLGLGDITGLEVKGFGGSDTITISGASVSSLIQGNGEADSITIKDALVADMTVGGGQGADTIRLSAAIAAVTAHVIGGAGADSIRLDTDNVGVPGDDSALFFTGGAGADTITISGGLQLSGSTYGTLVYSSLSESTLGGNDLFQVVSGTTSAVTDLSGSSLVNVDFGDAANLSAVATGVAVIRAGNVTSFATTNASGLVTFNGDLATTVLSSVTAAMEAVDTTLSTKSDVAIFTAAGAEYLFIQGGSAGTADDGLIKFGGLSASTLSDIGSAIEVTFSGAA